MIPAWLIFLAVGVTGAFLRAWADQGQHTWSRETVSDAFVGGVSSMIVPPLLGLIPSVGPALAAMAIPYQSALVFVIGFGASATWVLMVRQRAPLVLGKLADKVNP